MKRREFIQTTALASAASMLYACSGKSMEEERIGIQLYTLRDIIRKDVKGTLQAVADIGFKEIECYDYNNGNIFGIPYQDFNKMVHDMGMRITSGHYGLGVITPEESGSIINWEQAVNDAMDAGQEYLVIASIDKERRQSIDQYKMACDLMNHANETCRQAGLKLGYHNHEFEFTNLEDQVPFDIMIRELDPSITLELDLYWITFAGKNPLDYFNTYPGRFEQWHVKDMSKNNKKLQTDVGTGSIDFKAIFEKAELSGMKHYYLEQENYDVSEIDSIKKGYKYLQSI